MPANGGSDCGQCKPWGERVKSWINTDLVLKTMLLSSSKEKNKGRGGAVWTSYF